ncbi:MAG: 50S ribosomal protein L4 [Planctomycetaceae bacterium]|nr:50S ribosomal protein L4 [Planctomycetaceae bacterium]
MPKLTVLDAKGKKVGTYNLEPTDLAPRISKQLLHDAVVMYQANARQGTHKTKRRSEVAGSTKKMYRQKGTGNARAGHRKSGVRRGGGHMKQIHPRSHGYSLTRKALQLATRMALAAKLNDEELVVVDKLEFAAPKTREMAGVIKAVGCDGSSLLVTTAEHDVNVYKSARNIAAVAVSPASDLNALKLLSADKVLVTTAALDFLKAKAGQGGHGQEAAAEA